MRLSRLTPVIGACLTLAVTIACGGGGGGGSPAAPTPPPTGPGPTPVSSPDSTARYRVTFDSTWSARSHPDDFPSNAHFSPLIGGTHDEATRFWEVGDFATAGIKAMSETGATSPLDREINRAITAGRAEHLLRGRPLGRSPGRITMEFDVGVDFPFVTLVTMIAPSPDWFVGVSGLSLMEDGDWAQRIGVELFAYDAGTDSGTRHTSPNQPSSPREPISRIETSPFVVNGSLRSLGTFTFRRLD